jgi:hypothetical protein
VVLVLLPVELPPLDGCGAATTGAGEDVVVGGGADCVVVEGGACVEVVAAGVATGLGLLTVLWCFTVFLAFLAGSVVLVVDVVDVVADAAFVEVVFEADVPPQPATARATAIVLSTSFFISPAPILRCQASLSGYKTPRAQVCSGRAPT